MKKISINFKRGMTFIELIVVIGIFATISGVVLFNFTGFTTSISLQNLANQIALQIKKAQTESLSGRGGVALFGPNKPSFGVHFDATKQDRFIYFADLNNDGAYDVNSICGTANTAEECLDEITIQTGDKVTGLVADCSANPIFDLTFKRPFPDSIFSRDGAIKQVAKAGIEITSSKGAKKTIIAWSTGQVEIKSGDYASNGFTNLSCQ